MTALHKRISGTSLILLSLFLGSALLSLEGACCRSECCLEKGCQVTKMAEELQIPPSQRLAFAAEMAQGGFCAPTDSLRQVAECCCQGRVAR